MLEPFHRPRFSPETITQKRKPNAPKNVFDDSYISHLPPHLPL